LPKGNTPVEDAQPVVATINPNIIKRIVVSRPFFNEGKHTLTVRPIKRWSDSKKSDVLKPATVQYQSAANWLMSTLSVRHAYR